MGSFKAAEDNLFAFSVKRLYIFFYICSTKLPQGFGNEIFFQHPKSPILFFNIYFIFQDFIFQHLRSPISNLICMPNLNRMRTFIYTFSNCKMVNYFNDIYWWQWGWIGELFDSTNYWTKMVFICIHNWTSLMK